MTGRTVASLRPEPVNRSRYVEVSSIVEIDAISPEAANRLTVMVTGSAKGHGEEDAGLRVESIYNPGVGRLKLIVTGSLGTVRQLLGGIAFMLEQI